MGVDMSSGCKVRMSQPFLNLLDGYTVSKQHTCTGMAKIVKAHPLETVTHKENI